MTAEATAALASTPEATPTLAVALALVLDAAVGEPPTRLHPVAWFGSLVAHFDREWSRPRAVGLAVATVLPLFAGATTTLAVALAADLHPQAATLVAGLVLFSTTSLRMLYRKAVEVVALTETDLPTARERLHWLAGRDATDLSASEVRSAAVESAAENLADGVVAPLLAFTALTAVSLTVGAPPGPALAVGAGGAAWVKAVNTLDSMFGYPDVAHGTASARLDDVTMLIPARVSACLLALAALAPATLRTASEWADAPPSPNSGWPMATLAVALGARFEKPGVYVLNPDATLPSVETARRGIRVVGLAGVVAYLVGAGLAVGGAVLAPTVLSPTGEVVAWF